MTYEEIIAQNYLNKWWAEFAFHYTDMSNAVNILRDGCLYSREDIVFRNTITFIWGTLTVTMTIMYPSLSVVRFTTTAS